MDPFEASGDDRANTEQRRSFRGPVVRASSAVVLACKYQQRNARLLVARGSVVDGYPFAARLVNGDASLRPRNNQISNEYIGESAERHDFVVDATRSDDVEDLR